MKERYNFNVYKYREADIEDFQLTEQELAYIAGFFDGEGSIGINRSKRQTWLEVCFANTDEPIIAWIYSKLGGRIRVIDRSQKNPKWKKAFYAISSSARACKILRTLLPYLRVKKDQAEIAIEYWSLKEQFDGTLAERTDAELALKERLQSSRTASPLRLEI